MSLIIKSAVSSPITIARIAPATAHAAAVFGPELKSPHWLATPLAFHRVAPSAIVDCSI